MIGKKPSASLLFLTLFFAAFASFAWGADKTPIECRWPEGNYAIRQDMFLSAIDTTANKEVVGRAQTRAQFIWFVNASKEDGGEQSLTLKATRVLLRFEGDGEELFYSDSENSLNGKAFEKEVYACFFENPVTIWFKNGAFDRVEGCDKLWEKAPTPQDEESNQFLRRLQSIATPENFGDVFKQLSYATSSEPVAVGDAWTTTVRYALPSLGEKEIAWNCRWNSEQKLGGSRLAKVDATSSLDLTAEANSTVEMNIEAKYDLTEGNVVSFGARATIQTVRQALVNDDAQKTEVKTVVLIRNNLTVAKR